MSSRRVELALDRWGRRRIAIVGTLGVCGREEGGRVAVRIRGRDRRQVNSQPLQLADSEGQGYSSSIAGRVFESLIVLWGEAEGDLHLLRNDRVPFDTMSILSRSRN